MIQKFYKHNYIFIFYIIMSNSLSHNFATTHRVLLMDFSFALFYHLDLVRNFDWKKILTFLLVFLLHLCDTFPISNLLKYNYKWAIWLYIGGDIEVNPGPKTEHFRFCHWNINSIPAHGFSRLSLVQAYMVQHDLHIAALSETALKPEIHNSEIDIPGYIPIRYDLAGNDTHGGVLIYHKQGLSVKQRTDLSIPSYTLVLELSINRKQFFFYLVL